MKISFIVLPLLFGLVWSGCVLESPVPWNSQQPIETIVCDTNYIIKWNDTDPKGQGLQGNLYETISGNFETTLFDDTLLNLNESKTIKFSCLLNDTLYYQLILLETPYSPTRYDCRSKSIKITKCGNSVLDTSEECEYTIESGCNSECFCYNDHTRVEDQCCRKLQPCNFNFDLNITKPSDFSDLQIKVSGDIIINKNITVNIKTTIDADCVNIANAYIVVNAKDAKVGDIFKIKSNCSIFDEKKIDIVNVDPCIYQNTSYKNGIFILNFEKVQNCEVKQIVQKYAGLIVGLVLAGVVIILIILSTIKKFRKVVFPWRNKKDVTDDNEILDGNQIEKDLNGEIEEDKREIEEDKREIEEDKVEIEEDIENQIEEVDNEIILSD